MFGDTYRNLKPGMFVKYRIPNGLSIKNGKTVQDWKEKRSKIVITFEHHVVVNGGGRYGTPYVVDDNNIIL
jgi:hypothetical protein